jgi:hypothetical protein
MECDEGKTWWKDVDKYKITEIKPLGEIKFLAEPRQTPNCAICEWKRDGSCEQYNVCSAQGFNLSSKTYNSPECQKLFKLEEPPTCAPAPEDELMTCGEEWEEYQKEGLGATSREACFSRGFWAGAKNEALKYKPLIKKANVVCELFENYNSTSISYLVNELEKLNQSN